MAAASDNLTSEGTENIGDHSQLHPQIKDIPEGVLYSQRQPDPNASVSSKNGDLAQRVADSKGQHFKVPQLDTRENAGYIMDMHGTSPQKHREPQKNQNMQPCKVPQVGLSEAGVRVGEAPTEAKCEVGEPPAKKRFAKVPQFGAWDSASDNQGEGYTGLFTRAILDRNTPLPSCTSQSKNFARFPLLDEQYLNHRTLTQIFWATDGDSGGGRRLVHEQRDNNFKDASQAKITTRGLPASSPVPQTSLRNHKEIPRLKVRSINTQEKKKPRCFPWFGRR